MAGYYQTDEVNPYGAEANASTDLTEAYNNFKADLQRPFDQTSMDMTDKQAFTAMVGTQYSGYDLNDPRVVLDAARVAIVDPGHEQSYELKTGGEGSDPEWGMRIKDATQDLLFTEDRSPEQQAVTEGVLRSWGGQNADGSKLTIDGERGANDIGAENKFWEQITSYFTLDEAMGQSGAENADIAPQDHRPDASQGTIDSLIRQADDTSLYVPGGAMKGDIGPDSIVLSKNPNDIPATKVFALDENPTELSTTQTMMLQGIMTVVYGEEAVGGVDGMAGRKTKETTEDFLRENGFDDLADSIATDGLNSHHFEAVRNIAITLHEHKAEVNGIVLGDKMHEMVNEAVGDNPNIVKAQHNDDIMAVQAAMNILGSRTAMDGMYGGQTQKNMNELDAKYMRDPDADFTRTMPMMKP